MATIKIKMRKELITVEFDRAKKLKILRFGDMDGRGKAPMSDDIDIIATDGSMWSGTVGLIEWVDLGKPVQAAGFKIIRKSGVTDRVFQVPLNYKLQKGEEFA